MSGVEYLVSDKEAQAAKAAMTGGGVLDLGFSLLNAKSIEAIENVGEVVLRSNPIITDANFKKWLDGDMRAVDLLNAQYAGPRFENDWKIAIDYKKQVLAGEVKLLS